MSGDAFTIRRIAVVALGLLLACCRCALALNPSLDINQYAHKAWTIREGFFKGAITAIAQTPDGYLWLGTEFGLLLFDGVRFVEWQPPPGEHLPGSYVRNLLAARDGRLWIGTTHGLASWKDGRLTHYPELAGQDAFTLLEDREGTLWIGGGGPAKKLCAIGNGSVRCYGEDGRFGRGVAHIYEDSGGNLWVGALAGLWRWKPGPPKLYPLPGPVPEIRSLIETNNGALLLAMRDGIRQFVDGNAEAYPLPDAGRQPTQLFRDRNGGLWIGTVDRGLLHVHQGKTDVFAQPDGLSSDVVHRLFEDREGNVWVATRNGLDRFREFAVPTIGLKQGLSTAGVWSVLAAADGSVWLGTPAGLNRWKDGQLTIYRGRRKDRSAQGTPPVAARKEVREITDEGLPDDDVHSLFQDDRGRIWASTPRGVARFENGRFVPVGGLPGGVVNFIVQDSAGGLWFSYQDQGLFHLKGESVVEQIPWARLGHQDDAYVLLPDPARGGIWLGFVRGGLVYFKDGEVRASYAGADGLGEGYIGDLRLDRDGTVWAATAGGLSRVKNRRVATLTTNNGLPCDGVQWMMEDDAHSFWLSTACGLLSMGRPELDAWGKDPKRIIQTTIFDSVDGVGSRPLPGGFSPRVAKSADGKLWFLAAGEGVSVLDPRYLPFNKLPPPVHIEQITADRKKYETSSNLRLPPLVRDLQIDYTALSFVAPEKVRFRVELEGWDRDWKDAGNERKAFYSNLPPRQYRFRVMACNNSGVWNEAGDSLEFSVDPAYYQTTWFRASCVAALLALLWGLHLYRLHQIAERFNARLEGRVDERLRVARELHDTLLQSFQGLLLQFQGAHNLFPKQPEQALKTLEGAIDLASDAIREGREAIQNLRSSTVISNELAKAVEVLGKELAEQQRAANGDAPAFSVEVEGASRELHPILRDEVYRMTGEALRNAFRHARARRIEVEIRYDARGLRVRVRDDGIGIDARLLQEGRTGHYGLPGMRERAKSIGGQLDVWSEQGAGTEVELTIPASVAYASHASRRFRLFKGGPGTNS